MIKTSKAAVLFQLGAPTKRQALRLEPQANLPHLPGVGIQPMYQAPQAFSS